jgi:hypothetical protein
MQVQQDVVFIALVVAPPTGHVLETNGTPFSVQQQ